MERYLHLQRRFSSYDSGRKNFYSVIPAACASDRKRQISYSIKNEGREGFFRITGDDYMADNNGDVWTFPIMVYPLVKRFWNFILHYTLY